MLGEKPQPQARCLKAGFCIRVAALLSAAPRMGKQQPGFLLLSAPICVWELNTHGAREVRKNVGFCSRAADCYLSSLKVAYAFHLIEEGGGVCSFVCLFVAQNLWKEHWDSHDLHPVDEPVLIIRLACSTCCLESVSLSHRKKFQQK